jgi:hypothetical protein
MSDRPSCTALSASVQRSVAIEGAGDVTNCRPSAVRWNLLKHGFDHRVARDSAEGILLEGSWS